MLIKKSKQIKRDKSCKRIFLILLSFLVIFSSGTFPGYTEADIISRGPNLKQVGPINESNGFPLWYKDSNNVKLELCLDDDDPLCALVPEGGDFNADLPITFPNNYPGEAFYQLAGAGMDNANGGNASATFALEATFNNETPAAGDQTVFGRVRFRVDNLTVGETYRITHPYGVDEFIAEASNTGTGEINYTEDVGAGQGLDGALNSRIGTFLQWDPTEGDAAPAGYIGDPNVDHAVIGGVNNQNFFRIEGPGIGLIYPDFTCDFDPTNCIETDQFSLMGKIAVNNGLDIQQATYSQTTSDSGSIDVFVSSEIEQAIEVSGAGIATTSLAGGNGQYYAHVPYTGTQPPAEVTVTNVDDTPDTVKTIALTDRITALADYNPDNKTLTITAKSSDEANLPTLSVTGYGDINPETGTLVIPDLAYISPTVTITSTKKGTITIPVNITSGSTTPDTVTVTALAGDDQSVTVDGQEQITLDGSRSTGPIQRYQWTQLSPTPAVVITGANRAIATFPTPATPGEYVFQLRVTGINNRVSTSTTKIVVLAETPDPGAAPIANAGPDQNEVTQGTVVTLDGTDSTNATSYSWEQISGRPVTLNSANTANPTFTFPKQPSPLAFRLTVTGADGTTATDTVEISAASDNPDVTTAEFRGRDGSWRIDGTSDVFGPGVTITLKIVDTANPNGVVLGTTSVDNLGNWRFRARRTGQALGQGSTLIIESSSGGILTNVPLTIR